MNLTTLIEILFGITLIGDLILCIFYTPKHSELLKILLSYDTTFRVCGFIITDIIRRKIKQTKVEELRNQKLLNTLEG